MLHATSCYAGLRYNGTWLYVDMGKMRKCTIMHAYHFNKLRPCTDNDSNVKAYMDLAIRCPQKGC